MGLTSINFLTVHFRIIFLLDFLLPQFLVFKILLFLFPTLGISHLLFYLFNILFFVSISARITSLTTSEASWYPVFINATKLSINYHCVAINLTAVAPVISDFGGAFVSVLNKGVALGIVGVDITNNPESLDITISTKHSLQFLLVSFVTESANKHSLLSISSNFPVVFRLVLRLYLYLLVCQMLNDFFLLDSLFSLRFCFF